MDPRHVALRFGRHLLVALGVLCGCGRAAGGAPPKSTDAPSAAAAEASRTTHWTGRLAAGRVLDIRELGGRVHVTAAPGDVADVSASVAGDGRPPLRIVEDERGVTIRVEGRDGSCDDDGREGSIKSVDIEAKVPADVRLVVRTVGGSIAVDGVTGPIDARAVDGSVDLRAVTASQAHTVNGAIHASFSGNGPADDSELVTVNGAVDVTLGPSASAEVAARSLNGAVRVDFPVSGSLEPHVARGSIGHGGHELRLRTVNGAIHVARGAS